MGCCIKTKNSRVRYANAVENETKLNDTNSMFVNSKNLVIEKKSNIMDNVKILSKLGEGSFGSVYKVIDKTSKLIRAMKVIKKETLMEQDDEQKFLKEIEILVSIDHPNIVKIFEYYADNNNYYLIIEYVNGTELYSEVTTWTEFSEQKSAFIIRQLISAVFYLHSQNIVHRDIKPENVMIEKTRKGSDKITIKLIDFGTCNFLEPGNFLEMTVGTPYFIAPEVLEGKYDHKCDVWSLGVTFYILLCGFPPFVGRNQTEIFKEIKKGTLSFEHKEFNKISQEAKDLLSLMLKKDFRKRISAGDCLNHNWFKKFETEEKVEAEVLATVLNNIKKFNIKETFQKTVIAFIVHLVQNTKEIEQLKLIFSMIDRNGDGKLTYDEMRDGFSKVFGEHLTEYEFENILSKIDLNADGYIGYEEFLRVALCQQSILSEQNLQMAFSKLDENGDGALSVEELKIIMGANDGPIFREFFKNLSPDADGNITYERFSELMKSIVNEIELPKTKEKKSGTFDMNDLAISGTVSFKSEKLQIKPKRHLSNFVKEGLSD